MNAQVVNTRGRKPYVAEHFDLFASKNRSYLKSVSSTIEAFDIYSSWVSKTPHKEISESSFKKCFKQSSFYSTRSASTAKSEPTVKKSKSSQYLNLIEQFEALQSYITFINKGLINSLFIYGLPGIGKTDIVTNTLKKISPKYKYYNGGIKGAYDLARILYFNRNNKVIVFDDFDTILENKECKRLLKAALQDHPVRQISWVDHARNSKRDGIPEQFEFTSTVIFISNKTIIDRAIKDRSVPVCIDGTPEEILEWVRHNFSTFLPKQPMKFKMEVYHFVKENIGKFKTMSFRKFKLIMLDYLAFSGRQNDTYWKKIVLHKAGI